MAVTSKFCYKVASFILLTYSLIFFILLFILYSLIVQYVTCYNHSTTTGSSKFTYSVRTNATSGVTGINVTTSEGPLVHTEYGPVRGVYLQEGRQAVGYLGIPYAAPPIRELRWQPPQKHCGWDRVYEAISQPPGCPQNCMEPRDQCPASVS